MRFRRFVAAAVVVTAMAVPSVVHAERDVHSEGVKDLRAERSFDLDAGKVVTTAKADLGYVDDISLADTLDFGFWQEGDAEFGLYGTSKPSYRQCKNAGKYDIAYEFEDLDPGLWFCFKTGAGRIARLKVLALPDDPSEPFRFRWLTWVK